jgi:hypothetical protein
MKIGVHVCAALAAALCWAGAVACQADEPKAKPAAEKAEPAGKGPAPMDRLEAARRQVAEAMRQAEEQLQKLSEGDQAKEVRQRLSELRRQMELLTREAGPYLPDRESIRRRLEEIRRQAERFRSEGKSDEVERLRGEAHELMRRMEGAWEGFRRGGEGREMPEPMRRARRLRIAAENLREAGMNEMAEKVRKELEALEREHPELRRAEASRGEARPDRLPLDPAGAPPRELQELRERMDRMNRDIDDMREQMKKFRERRE